MANVQPSTKACHNCRRQRLRCDRSHPSCNKCVRAGRECLGYGQLFRWTGAVASRGRFAGKKSIAAGQAGDDDSGQNGEKEISKSWEYKSGTKIGDGRNDEMGMVHAEEVASPWVLTDPLFQDMGQPYRYYLSYFTTRVVKDLVSYDLPDNNPFRTLLPLTFSQPLLQHILVAASAAHMSVLLRAPVPTTFQGGSTAHSLLPGNETPPTSHLTLPFSSSATGGTSGINSRSSMSEIQANHLASPSTMSAARTALCDSLVAKQKALSLMQEAVQNIETVGPDVVLAAAMFFVNVELIESGRHGWRAHLEGAGKVMAMLPMDDEDGSMSVLRSYLLSDCFVYYILACTFRPLESNPTTFNPSRMPSTLSRAAANSYLCCPPEILETLYKASQVSAALAQGQISGEEAAEAGAELLRKTQGFDVQGWAEDVNKRTEFRGVDVRSRVHAGSAHRGAACLYIIQAVEGAAAAAAATATAPPSPMAFPDQESTFASAASTPFWPYPATPSEPPSPSNPTTSNPQTPFTPEPSLPNPLTSESLARSILHHLSLIPDEDPNFKATGWPTFIAAASTKDAEKRAWIMERLRRLIFWCPWGFLYTAMETLEVIWGFDEEEEGDGRGWLQRLRDPEMNFLIV